ncbi:MAG TPA: hypothetical protein VFL67_10435 [Mycobacterium sp.]|nr:hypothetical protein [Mycobacterium sp.]
MPVITLPTPGVTTGPTWASQLVTAITDVNTQVDTNTADIATKITAFSDPNADRIVFWDDSAGAFVALTHNAPLTISGTSLTVAASSATAQGIVELATDTEAQTGTDTARAVTPANLTYIRGLYIGINAQTGTTYAPVLTDYGKLVTCTNAAAITVTLPSNATTAFPIGASIDFVTLGAGLVTFVAGSGATAVATPSLVMRATNSAATATKISTNGWLVVGDLA